MPPTASQARLTADGRLARTYGGAMAGRTLVTHRTAPRDQITPFTDRGIRVVRVEPLEEPDSGALQSQGGDAS
ncbi:hypothetical protein [Streptomyces sp. NPDC042319]|uniref:hypothetical protein n=1 Tax=Streptomyces sp. NPDC042319 TaxID=3154332 RepID=UPI0033D7492C